MRIETVSTPDHLEAARELMRRYFLSWGPDSEHDPDLIDELARLDHWYAPPDGCILVAHLEGGPVGVVALRRADGATCQMKRLFVAPTHRKRGIGRALTLALILEAAGMGYTRMRLDTPSDNDPALGMYRSLGFGDIEPYFDPSHGHVHENWSFLARPLPRDEDERQHLMQLLLEAVYLADDDPRAQSGFTGDEQRWRAKREVIVDALHRDGRYFDVGCANGYLLESLVRWGAARGRVIEPHGLDVSQRLVSLARQRLPQWAENFHAGDALSWHPPRRYDFVGTLLDVAPPGRRRELLDRLVSWLEPGGRLIVCCYSDPGAREDLAEIRSWGYPISEPVEGPAVAERPSPPTVVAWIQP